MNRSTLTPDKRKYDFTTKIGIRKHGKEVFNP
jgi:hypothetical protein